MTPYLEHCAATATARLERELDDGVAWDQLLRALVDRGMVDEALCGIELATDAGLVNAERHVRLVHHLHLRGEQELALLVAAGAAARFPTVASVWVALGHLCLEAGDDGRAERAYELARRLGNGSAVAPCLPYSADA